MLLIWNTSVAVAVVRQARVSAVEYGCIDFGSQGARRLASFVATKLTSTLRYREAAVHEYRLSALMERSTQWPVTTHRDANLDGAELTPILGDRRVVALGRPA